MTTTLIAGCGMAVPQTCYSNGDVVERILAYGGKADTTAQWIEEMTGIKSRYWIDPALGESTVSLASDAARDALSKAGLHVKDICRIIVATVTPDQRGVPATASAVLGRLGGSGRASAFDVNAGCTGFLSALEWGALAISAGDGPTLVIGVDCLSRITDIGDRNTAPLFGDGAGAVVLVPSNSDQVGLYPVITSGQANTEVLYVSSEGYICMDGKTVFRLAVTEGTRLLEEVMERDGIAPDTLAWVFLHQANGRITDSIRKGLLQKRSADIRFSAGIKRYGNTSSASIPIDLAEAVRDGQLNKGDHFLMLAFGAGLTSAVAHIVWGR